MKLLILKHPVHGICAQRVIVACATPYTIMSAWRYKYGKKFLECEVIEEDMRPQAKK